MDDLRLGAVVRAVRMRRGLRQQDLAKLAGVAHATVSLVERGHCRTLSLETIRRIGAAIDIRVELLGRWRGGDVDRLLSQRHSALAESFASFLASHAGWVVEPEVSFAIYGERGVIDQLGWNAATGHLLVIELKTAFIDINEMLGTLDRKQRLIRSIAAERGWHPSRVSVWLIVSDTRTNRRHAVEHATLLRSRFRLDGRQLRSFLRNPFEATTGIAFWTDSNPGSTKQRTRVRSARG
ncbi:MAG: helix-turn-helix transcriptional regulator [Candidatus Limnocylindrales bacterium]